MPREIDMIVVHCSDSVFGNASLIDEWHRDRGWDGIGYHFVVLNGYLTADDHRLKRPQFWLDGTIQNGRPIERVGAHSKGYNNHSVGICLIGVSQFTMGQFESLEKLINGIRREFPDARTVGHYEIAADGRSCPNIDMDWLRERL